MRECLLSKIYLEFEFENFSIIDALSNFKTKVDFINDLSNISSNPAIFLNVYRLLTIISDNETMLLQQLVTYKTFDLQKGYAGEPENVAALEEKIAELKITMVELKNIYAKVIVDTYFKKAIFIQNTVS